MVAATAGGGVRCGCGVAIDDAQVEMEKETVEFGEVALAGGVVVGVCVRVGRGAALPLVGSEGGVAERG